MNSKIQKFDIGFSLQEKFEELTVERGMDRDAAMRLIAEGFAEWSASHETVSGGAGWAMNCQTWKIRACDRAAVGDGEVWFEMYIGATDYLVQRARR